MPRKIFTVHEANKRLPLVKKIVGDILVKGQRLKALTLFEPTPSVEEEQNVLGEEIEELMHELENLGCYFKDWNFEIGLVDFPAIIEEEEVLLCWRSDEPGIAWYHDFENGYAGRKPIPGYLLKPASS